MSVEIWNDSATGLLRCVHGDISSSSVWPDDPGALHGMGPLILVTVPFEHDTANLAEVGIDFTVSDDGVARAVARNGTWSYRLQPAHWRNGVAPVGWSPTVMLGVRIA